MQSVVVARRSIANVDVTRSDRSRLSLPNGPDPRGVCQCSDQMF